MNRRIFYSLLICTGLACAVIVKDQPALDTTEGDRWLAWSDHSRSAFVEGYLAGYRGGHLNGCLRHGEIVFPHLKSRSFPLDELPDVRCIDRTERFPQSDDHYAGLMTNFYMKYPGGRHLPARSLLLALAGEPKGIQELYDLYQCGRLGKHVRDEKWVGKCPG